jgi:uncharacterized MnhB-related membrane protein
MTTVVQILLLFLIVCAIAVSVTRSLLGSVIIYMTFSMVMSIVWILIKAPDLAITEAAVGSGITSLLFFLTLKRIRAIDARKKQEETSARAEEAGEK